MRSVPKEASEGDVESSLLLPLLTRSEFLNLPLDEIRNKQGIAASDIGKGSKRKLGYIPDFCVYKYSIPILVIEAKSPGNDVRQAYSEAGLYALEINKAFRHKLNPCCRIIASNGIELLAGHWDAEPELSIAVDQIVPASTVLDSLISLLGNETLNQIAVPILKSLRASDFKRPFNQGSGQVQIDARIDPNTFAADLDPVLRRYFSSRDQTTDEEIYSRAYISSN
jgi:hypothetical protein